MAQSKKDNPIRAALLTNGNVKRTDREEQVQESGALMVRTKDKKQSMALAIESRRAEFKQFKQITKQ